MRLQAFGRDADYRVGFGEMGHTIDLDRLPESPIVLDAGCRGFVFSSDITLLRSGARVIGLDPDPSIKEELIVGSEFWRMALVGSNKSKGCYISTSDWADGGANFIAESYPTTDRIIRPDSGWEFSRFKVETVPCVNIPNLMIAARVRHWDVVKLDIEGAEFEVLENWPGPIATQISVEFHDFTGPRREMVNAGYYENVLWPHLFQWYEIAQHEWVDLNGSPAHFGHWDSLLVLK